MASVTQFQTKVYTLLQQIPEGRVSTYKAIASALQSSPRAVGNACANNPFAPEVPCHRCIASDGYIGGYKGDWRDRPSGVNMDKKTVLLKEEGVEFDASGKLIDQGLFWDEFDVRKCK
ncbi:6-O-methylguanine DNA methyltransferase [Lineolata rhizophorae]|uniref:Methylated-DNA--protein-cysteine methyltransferase n=1 Tax=Lineolata rhizophorae TaxID=578093 RepID=A0A6A6PD25_9PEZI|nr:6-O-methylguanine DNA methyltransferase [Lineolata rhizophorae]